MQLADKRNQMQNRKVPSGLAAELDPRIWEVSQSKGFLICKACTMVHGRRGEKITVMGKKDAYLSHLGLKSRAPKPNNKAKQGGQQQQQGDKQQQLGDQQQQQEGDQQQAKKPSKHDWAVEKYLQQLSSLALQGGVREEAKATPIGTGLDAACKREYMEKLAQFSLLFSLFTHGRPMLAYEQLGKELCRFWANNGLLTAMPNRHFSDNAGWDMLVCMDEVVQGSLREALNSSPVVSISMDEVSALGRMSLLGLHIYYMDDLQRKQCFVGLHEINCAPNAVNLTEATLTSLAKWCSMEPDEIMIKLSTHQMQTPQLISST